MADQETNKTLCNAKNELKTNIIAVFINLNKALAGKACKRFQSCLESVVEANSNFFEWIQFIVFEDIFLEF